MAIIVRWVYDVRMTKPENTSKRDPLLLSAGLLGGSDSFITGMEAQGQRDLVSSTSLPADMGPAVEEFEALGFTFGPVDQDDPLFRPATLPAGWRKEGSDHSMWSYVVDELGRRRVAIFYKAAFYDRRAHMYLISLQSYVAEALYENRPLRRDDSWCDRQAVHDALVAIRAGRIQRRELYSASKAPWAAEELAKIDQEIAKADAMLTSFPAVES